MGNSVIQEALFYKSSFSAIPKISPHTQNFRCLHDEGWDFSSVPWNSKGCTLTLFGSVVSFPPPFQAKVPCLGLYSPSPVIKKSLFLPKRASQQLYKSELDSPPLPVHLFIFLELERTLKKKKKNAYFCELELRDFNKVKRSLENTLLRGGASFPTVYRLYPLEVKKERLSEPVDASQSCFFLSNTLTERKEKKHCFSFART